MPVPHLLLGPDPITPVGELWVSLLVLYVALENFQ